MALTRRRLLLSAAAASFAGPLRAQGDRKPIRILVGFPPGGGTDALTRFFADRMPEILGQPVIVENRPGAGGRLAAEAVLAAPPDGLTYMIAPNATPTFQMLVFGPPQVKWDILRDFSPVAGLATYPLGMAVSIESGVTSAQEFVRWARANPTRATFGTPGLGGQNHFLGLAFARAAGIELAVTPYKGSPPLMTDLLGGHVPAAITLMDQMLAQHRAGKVRIIGVFTEKRSALMPDIPTFAEQGFGVTLGEAWNAMWGPRGVPEAELERMRGAIRRILAAPGTREHLMGKLAAEPAFRDGAEVTRVQKAELDSWAPIIRASGFKPEQ